MGFAGKAKIGMGVAGQAHQTAAIVRTKTAHTGFADLQRGRFHAESVALWTGKGGMGDKLVHEAENDGVVGQLLQRSAHWRALGQRNRFDVAVQEVAECPHFLCFFVTQDGGKE